MYNQIFLGTKQKDRRSLNLLSASHVTLPTIYKESDLLVSNYPNPDLVDFEKLELRVRTRLNLTEPKTLNKTSNLRETDKDISVNESESEDSYNNNSDEDFDDIIFE